MGTMAFNTSKVYETIAVARVHRGNEVQPKDMVIRSNAKPSRAQYLAGRSQAIDMRLGNQV